MLKGESICGKRGTLFVEKELGEPVIGKDKGS